MESTQRNKGVILRDVAGFAMNELMEKSKVKLITMTKVNICAQCPIGDVCEKPCPKALKFFFASICSAWRALASWN